MDFDVANEIIVTRLGIFDAGSDGFSEGTVLAARLWDRSQDPPVQLASIDFPADNPWRTCGWESFQTTHHAVTPGHGISRNYHGRRLDGFRHDQQFFRESRERPLDRE